MNKLTKYIKDSSLDRYIRQIDVDYQSIKTGKSSNLKDISFSLLKHQVAFADRNIQELEQISCRQDETRDSISKFTQTVSNGFDRIELGLLELNSCLWQLYDVALEISQEIALVNNNLEHISNQLERQQKTLEEISLLLQKPYEAKALELRREGEKWLTNGMNNGGREREEDWKDAIRLLSLTIDNPIGMQDYVAWFQIGWLIWKFEGYIDKASDAFYRAQRLSAPNQDLFHIKSLRHLAHMHYLKGDFEKSYQTISKALKANKPKHGNVVQHNLMYDNARLAAKTGNEKEAMDLLERCIETKPETYLTMFSEEDFQISTEAMLELSSRKLLEARDNAKKKIISFQNSISKIKQAFENANIVLDEIFTKAQKEVSRLSELVDQADYITSLEIKEIVKTNHYTSMDTAGEQLQKKFNQLQAKLASNKEKIREVKNIHKKKKEDIKNQIQKAEEEYKKSQGVLGWLFTIGIVFPFTTLLIFGPMFLILYAIDRAVDIWTGYYGLLSVIAMLFLLYCIRSVYLTWKERREKVTELDNKYIRIEKTNEKSPSLQQEQRIITEKKERVIYAMDLLNLPAPDINSIGDFFKYY